MTTITVDNFSDTPGAGTTLRQAIAAAKNGDTIVIAPSSAAVIDMRAPLEFAGGKTLTVQANGNVRLNLNNFDKGTGQLGTSGLKIDAGADVTLAGISFSGVANGATNTAGKNGTPGEDGENGAVPSGAGVDGGDGVDGIGGNSPFTVSLIENFGTLTLNQSRVLGAVVQGGTGGTGGNQGSSGAYSGGDGGIGGIGIADGSHGGDGGNGGRGSDGGLGGNGGSAIGGILNHVGGVVNLVDSSVSNNRATGGDGGKGGLGGNGGNGGAGGEGGFNGAGGTGGDGGDGGDGGNGGDGGTGVGGIENLGTVNVVTTSILAANSGEGGAGGDEGAGGEPGTGGGGGSYLGPAPTTKAPDGIDGNTGKDGKGGAAGQAGDDLLNLGNNSGTYRTSGHFYDFDLIARPGSSLAADPTMQTALTLKYQVDIFGDTGTAGSVAWKVVSGADGPTAAEFGLASLPSGTVSFLGGLIAPGPASITLHLTPRVDAPAIESFTVVLYNPATGDVIGTQGQVVQHVTTGSPTANADFNAIAEYLVGSGNVLTGDPDASGKDTDPSNAALTVIAVDGDAGSVGAALTGAHGTLTLSADGSYSYNADRAEPLAIGATVVDSFTYTISNGYHTAIGKLDITVAGSGTGNAADNHLVGSAAADTLDGRGGADIMDGKGGDDAYLVDNVHDKVNEAVGQGYDTVYASTDWTLGAGSEVEALVANAGATGLKLVGNAFANTIIGGAGNDDLDGGANPEGPQGQGDILLGGDGNDTYHVDSGLDFVDEGVYFPAYGFGGSDTIISTADFYWDIASVGETIQVAENVVDPEGDGVTIVGGVFDNTLIGHSGTDIMFGRGGSDIYEGGDGVNWISLSTLGVTDAPNYTADGHNTIIVGPRTSGQFLYDIVFEFDPSRDKVDVSAYGSYASGADVLSHVVDDTAGNSYAILGDGLDYVFFVGVTKAQLLASDFLV